MSLLRGLVFSILVSHSFITLAEPWKSYLLNKEGIAQLQEESFDKSVNSFLKALETDPLNPALHLNLGLSLMAQGEPQKAAKAFQNAFSMSADPQLRFIALFNQAYALGEAKDIEKALDTYQQALEFDPESLEVKTNIELLTQNQSQDGQGGEGDQNQEQSSGEGNDEEKKDPSQGQNNEEQKPKPQPKEFKSKELSASDVKKILEELKSQEQGIRAKEYEKGAKERPSGMDW